jgi:hypothetical protein
MGRIVLITTLHGTKKHLDEAQKKAALSAHFMSR